MLEPFDSKTLELCARLEKLFVPAIADVLDEMGYRSQVMNHGFGSLIPEAVVAGPAFTVREVPAVTSDPRSTEEKLRIFSDFFGAVRPGQVVVVDTGGCFAAAAWGELMSTISRFTCGAKAAVVDGPIRDISRVLKVEFPVWAKGSIPADSEGRLALVDFDRPIRCGGVLVRPDDLIFADRDGVVVLPVTEMDVEAVIEKAERIVELEDRSRADLRAGVPVSEVFRRYGRL
jgi:4-hydroxy-4-methyl-2-oxoglutarate aldolase